MKLTYQTGIATLIQFIFFSFFTLVSQITSSITTCHKDSSNCISNLITSIILYILVAIFFGFIWLLGYAAQSRRNRQLALLLIAMESLVAFGALFSLKLGVHNKSILTIFISTVIGGIAVWIIVLARRLRKAGEGRIVRVRRRHTND